MHEDDELLNLPTNADKEPELSAEEIGEQVMESYFARAWGARPANAAPLELNDFERLHRSTNTMYVSGLVRLADITEALKLKKEQSREPPRAKIPADVLRRRDEIRLLAAKVLKSPRDAERWLETPIRYALKGRRPAELLQTLEGCDEVERLLNTLYS